MALEHLRRSQLSRYVLSMQHFITSLTFCLQGVAGLTKRDIQLIVEGGFHTVESVAYTPKRVLEQIKGISEQKATKILTEGGFLLMSLEGYC